MIDPKASILVIDDKENIRTLLADHLRTLGFHADEAESGDRGMEMFKARHFDLVITDVKMPGRSGMDVLGQVKSEHPDTEVILITAFADMEDAIRAMKLGAVDYIRKPFKLDEIEAVVRRALRASRLALENRFLKEQAESRYDFSFIVTDSPAMRHIFEMVKKIADSPAPALIMGETGVGKELIARAIHKNSQRADRHFIPVNCAAIPETLQESQMFGHVRGAFTGATANKRGCFEEAEGGMILLDEIGEISPGLQAKLLRALQDGEYTRVGESIPRRTDARVIASTNKDLKEMAEAGLFRRDLYYRLNVVQIRIPPLRERPEDIPLLMDYFLKKFAGDLNRDISGFDPQLYRLFQGYGWPGNIRELQNCIERAVLLGQGPAVCLEDLPYEIQEKLDLGAAPEPAGQDAGAGADGERAAEGGIRLELPEGMTSIKDHLPWVVGLAERMLIERALKASGGNRDKAAKILGISRRSLFYKLKAGGLQSEVDAEEGGAE